MRVRVPPSALVNIRAFGDEFDGRMLALGARGTGFNSLVPDRFDIIPTTRVWFNGRIGAFQAFDGGSIPPTRSQSIYCALELPIITITSPLEEASRL